jgi:asparagine synthase (glutamine-hydrolysing)
MPDRMEMYNLLLRVGADEVLTPRMLAQMDCAAPVVQQRQVWSRPAAASPVNRTLAFDWRYTLAENDLPKVTGSAALAGLQVAFPFLDRELLVFSMRLPSEYKLRGLKLRWFFKEALRGFLPDEILAKRKHGFGLPFGVWTVGHEGLQSLAADSLGSLADRGVIRGDFADRLMRQLLPQHPGYFGEMVWILMMLEQWFRRRRPSFAASAV